MSNNTALRILNFGHYSECEDFQSCKMKSLLSRPAVSWIPNFKAQRGPTAKLLLFLIVALLSLFH